VIWLATLWLDRFPQSSAGSLLFDAGCGFNFGSVSRKLDNSDLTGTIPTQLGQLPQLLDLYVQPRSLVSTTSHADACV